MSNKTKAELLKTKFLKDAEKIIIDEVQRIMRIHKNLVSFSDCMGLHVFENSKGDSIYFLEQYMSPNWEYRYRPTYKSCKNLIDIYHELLDGGSLGITINK